MKILQKLGLIREFNFTFRMEMSKTIELLTSKTSDRKIDFFDRLFSTRIPLNSTDFIFNHSKDSFIINRKSNINPSVGRGKILGHISSTDDNQTRIQLIIKTNYSDYKFILYAFIFMLVITLPGYYFRQITLELTVAFISFFIVVTLLMTVFQLYEMRKIINSLNDYFKRLK